MTSDSDDGPAPDTRASRTEGRFALYTSADAATGPSDSWARSAAKPAKKSASVRRPWSRNWTTSS